MSSTPEQKATLRAVAFEIEETIDPMRDRTVRVEEVLQSKGPALWAARTITACANRDGQFEREPRPSNRDDAFIARCRFATKEEAADAGLRAWLTTYVYSSPVGGLR